MLSSKIRKEDSLGHYAGSQLVVISPGTPAAACESFGNRLREAIRAANIAVHGQRLNLSVSVGVSNSPADAVVSAGALIELAGSRLKMAQQAGGNQVISCNPRADAVSSVVPALDQALALINEGQVAKVMPHLAELGLQVMPLLRLLERRFGFGLPLAEIEKRMTDPVQEKEDAGQD